MPLHRDSRLSEALCFSLSPPRCLLKILKMALAELSLLDICNEEDMLQSLIRYSEGQCDDWRDEKGTTALQICAGRGWADAVDFLLKHGSDACLPNDVGWTPLMQAARNGHSAIVEKLISAGAVVSEVNSFGYDTLCLAVAGRDERTIRMLIPLAEASRISCALAVSCCIGNSFSLQLMIDHAADVNMQLSQSGVSPLMLAASEGHTHILDILLSHGADPDIRNSLGFTALDVATCCGHKSSQEKLQPVTNVQGKVATSNPCMPCYPIPVFAEGTLYPPNFTSFFELSSLPPHNNASNAGVCPTVHHSLVTSALLSPCNLKPTNCIHAPLSHINFSMISPYMRSSSFQCPQSPESKFSNFGHFSPSAQLYPVSPTVPGWIFTPRLPQCRLQTELTEQKIERKRNKQIRRWWMQIKRRCKVKKHKCKAHMACKMEKGALIDRQLEALLVALKLDALCPLLQAQDMDVETFLSLTDKDLQELGIRDEALQTRVLHKIKLINEA